ncbi:MAG: hypothetical protein IPN15_03860 [Saprospiraceae bacterium]|nr:hypothetical protein [Candidatus Vicinibacter affinis]
MLYTDLKNCQNILIYIKLVPEDMHLMDALHKYGPEYYKADLMILEILNWRQSIRCRQMVHQRNTSTFN